MKNTFGTDVFVLVLVLGIFLFTLIKLPDVPISEWVSGISMLVYTICLFGYVFYIIQIIRSKGEKREYYFQVLALRVTPLSLVMLVMITTAKYYV